MTDPTLERLGALAKTLNEASDLISKQIGQIEAALNALRIGVWAWVEVKREEELFEDEDTDTKTTERHVMTNVLRLGYTKHKGKWQLVVSEGYEELDEVDVTPLREVKREVKLDAVEKIPHLLKAIEKKVAKVTEDATRKASAVASIAAALRKDAEAAGGR